MTNPTHLDLAQEYVEKARVAQTLQDYGFGCDTKDRAALLEVFADDARASYDGETWLVGGEAIVEWLLNALAGLTYSQHMITTPRIAIDADTARVVAYLNAHQRSGEPDALIRMNGRYDCELRQILGQWRVTSLSLGVGWFASA